MKRFAFLIFILPGLVTLKTREILVVPEKTTFADTVIVALVLTLIDHVISAVIPQLPAIQRLEERVTIQSEFWNLFKGYGGFKLLIFSGFLGLVLGLLRYYGWDYGFLRWLRLTRRTGFVDVWNEVFNRDPGSWLIVTLSDGTRYLGWAASYSDDPGTRELFLARASKVLDDGTQIPIEGPGILLTKESKILSVEFWSPVE